ncbi:MAG: low molecular weight protein arginine phosphatase [Candidatus Thorarchaeota archaeon]
MVKKFPYKSILVVCSVNTARSCMAEGLLKDYFLKNNLDVEVYSGGIASNARDGMLISIDAKLVMKEIGINLSDGSKSFDLKRHKGLIKRADLILTLTEKHKEEIMKYEEVDNKEVFTVKEFAGEYGDIADPSMRGIEGFRIARDEITECLMKGLQKFSC